MADGKFSEFGDNKMPHLIQLENSVEEVGILSDSRSEPCIANLLKAERVKQSHALQLR